jgi:repressor LexA
MLFLFIVQRYNPFKLPLTFTGMSYYNGCMNPNITSSPLFHPTQQKLYDLLARETQNESLSLREIAALIGVNSPNTVEHHLQQLEKKGYIFRNKESGRIEALKDPAADIMYLNLYGTAKCGPGGFFAEDNIIERMPLPAKQLHIKPSSFLIRAENDSMEPMILSGDLVVVEIVSAPTNGSVIVVTHEDGAKIKKLFVENGMMILQSLNSKYNPIVVKQGEGVSIEGVVRNIIGSRMDNLIA